MTRPEAPIVAIHELRGFHGYAATVDCPYCQSQHHHGIGYQPHPDGTHGHRVAHCHTYRERARDGYTITDPAGLVAEQAARRTATAP